VTQTPRDRVGSGGTRIDSIVAAGIT